MNRLLVPSLDLVGRIFAILMLALLIEVGASTFFYERASQLSVRDDEARRLAEHLVIARKLLDDEAPAGRPEEADELTTPRYAVNWSRDLPPRLRISSTLERVHKQVLAWEPSLGDAQLRLRLEGPAREAVVVGGLRLRDGSWMSFATRSPVHDQVFLFERLLPALAPAFAIVLIAGLLLRRTLQPMRRLAEAAERVGGATVESVPEGGPPELRRVIGAFNRMQDRIHRLIADRTQALAAVGHDLRTPLARLRLRADSVAEPGLRDAIEADVVEMEAMVSSLLAYLGGEADVETPAAIDLAVLCATVCDDARDRGRDAHYHGPVHFNFGARPVMLKRAVVNLVENALHYGNAVSVTLIADAAQVLIRVEDDGPGIPEDELAHVLEPFVRLDAARTRDTIGLGLGLSIVARSVNEHQGALTLSNRPEGGLRAEIALPSNLS